MGSFSYKASQFILSAITFTPRWGVGNDIEWFPSTRWGVENSSEPCKSTDNRTICHVPFVFAARWDGVKNGEGKTVLKIGQKVIGDDLYPLAEWSEVVAKDFWVLVEGLGKVVDVFWGTRRGVGCHCKRFLSHCFEVFHVGETRGVRPFAGRVCAMWKTTMTTFKGAAFASTWAVGLVGRIFYGFFFFIHIFPIFAPALHP